MGPYIFTTLAVAVFPTILAGYGGHLATLALPPGSRKKRNALFIVWGLALGGVLLFIASQIVAYKTDHTKEAKDNQFRDRVLASLTQIIEEPSRERQREYATQLKDWMSNPIQSRRGPKERNGTPPVDAALPSYGSTGSNGSIYPENFYQFLPYVWGFPSQNTYEFQFMMANKYQVKHRNSPPRGGVKISYLQGDPTSYSMALFLERVYGGGRWGTKLIPRTDIGHVTGIYLLQDSIENKYEGVDELRIFAKDNKIPWLFDEQPGVESGAFEIWVGRGPDHTGKP